MSMMKYTFGRVGLFVVIYAVLLPVPLNFLVRALIALMASFALSIFVLRKWRTEMVEMMDSSSRKRVEEKNRLRAALAGEDAATPPTEPAAASTPAASTPAAS